MSPVLGSTPDIVVKRGIIIPKGSLDVWRAARAAGAATRTEVVCFGDSTTFGSGANYSWVQKLRALAVAAGFSDGGRGIAGWSDVAAMSGPENIPIIQSQTGFNSPGDGLDMLLTETPTTFTIGATITFQGYGTKARLHYTKGAAFGSFTYSIDGGTPVTVNANLGSGFAADTLYLNLGGTDSTLHTITIVNAGGGSSNRVGVVAEFLKTAGITFHKQAISGITYGSFFGTANSNLGNYQAQLALGLVPGIGSSANSLGWGSPKATRPNYRNPSLAISALGINDQQGASSTNTDATEAGVEMFIRMARAAGADPLVVIPHLDYAANAHLYSGSFKRAIMAVAEAHQCATVDFNEALGPINVGASLYGVGPHLNQAAHDAEAGFLWTNALSL